MLVVVLVPLNALLQRQRPEELGILPDGDGTLQQANARTRRADNVVDPEWTAVDWTLARAIRTTRFWWLLVAFFGGLFAWYAVQVHQTRYLIDIGFSPTVAASALGLVGFSGVLGQIALGHLSDRIGREWVWTISGLGYIACYGLLLVLRHHPTLPLLYLMVACQGLLGYALAAVFGAIPAELFQGRHYGAIFGALGLGSGSGAALGPWVTGLLYDQTGSYAPAFWLAMLFSGVSIVAVWFAAPRKVRIVAGRVARRGGEGERENDEP